jgi:hypothetical protein
LFRNLEGFDELRNSLVVVTNFNAESGPVVELLCKKVWGVSFVNKGRHVEMWEVAMSSWCCWSLWPFLKIAFFSFRSGIQVVEA